MGKQANGYHIGTITGVEEVLAALAKLEPELYRELIAEVKAEADAMVADIDGNVPGDAPMSGFEHNGRTGWAKRGAAYAKQSTQVLDTDGTEWPVYKVGLGGYAGAVTDIAGAGGVGNTDSGKQMIAVLNSRHAKASRWVWPVGNKHKQAIEAKMKDAAEKVSKALTEKVAR